jgi:YHS domain-containing protein
MIRKLLVVVLVFAAGQAMSQVQLINLNSGGIIIDGYDAVEYFNTGKPTRGVDKFQSSHNGAIYLFANEENKKRFEENKEKYAVQFGGFCAYAVSQGHVSPIDPNFCVVQKNDQGEDVLICQHNQKAADLWNKNPTALLSDAERYWPAVEKNGGKQIPLKGVEHFFINLDKDGLANQGYDVVAYFTDMKAVRGDEKYSEWFHGAKYFFSSDEHQRAFREDPKKYLPQYGGFCAYAMSLGKVRPVDPEIFSIEDGRLMLQHTRDAYDKFYQDLEGNIQKADAKWPDVNKKHAGKAVKFDKPAK